MIVPSHCKAWRGPLLWLVLALPPVRHGLEATMALQMLVQIPLLALTGWWLYLRMSGGIRDSVATWNQNGVSGIVLVSLTAMVWMLPRSMDAALEAPWIETAKFFSVPLLIGLPLAASWPRAGFVARGVFLAEVIATTFRLGWLYLISPERLCSNYPLGDQQWLGRILLGVGVAICLRVAWKLLWGHFDSSSKPLPAQRNPTGNPTETGREMRAA